MTRILLFSATACLVFTFALAGPAEDARKLLKDGKYDEAIALLEKADQKQPATAKGLVEAHMAKADYFMNNDQVPPRTRYTTALHEYRKVLVYDKTNKKAQDNIKLIEDIYKSMGRPIPQ
jgi:tetratricopeptide (TPR) repeat protein